MKIAVVSGAVIDLGISVIKDLLEKEYKVFVLTLDQTQRILLRGIETSTQLSFISGSGRNLEDWVTLAREIKFSCGSLGIETKIDLLVNLSSVSTPSSETVTTVFDLEYAMTKTLHPLFLATPVLMPLLKEASNSEIISVYPDYSDSSSNSIANTLAKASTDVLTRYLAQEVLKENIHINSLCYPIDGYDEEKISHGINNIRDNHSRSGTISRLGLEGLVIPQTSSEVLYA